MKRNHLRKKHRIEKSNDYNFKKKIFYEFGNQLYELKTCESQGNIKLALIVITAK